MRRAYSDARPESIQPRIEEPKPPQQQTVGLAFALIFVSRGCSPPRRESLETVVSSEVELPDELMTKYRVGGALPLDIGHLEINVPWSSAAAALALASAYEKTGRVEDAIGVLQQLADAAARLCSSRCVTSMPTPGRGDEIVLAAAGTKNEDDISLQLRLYQARALREQGMNEAALDAYKDALRSKKRDPELLNDARYARGRLLLEMGKTSQAMKDLQTVYADDPGYEDAAELVRANRP